MLRVSIKFLIIAAAMLAAGCATPPAALPPELQYQPPPSEQAIGTIVGSQENSSWADDFTAFVIGVDGKRVMAGRKAWAVPLPLAAGSRRLVVQFQRGVFTSNAVLSADVAQGAALELRFSTDVAAYGTNSYCDFWIVDTSSNKAITDIVRGPVRGGGSSTFIPIYVPKK